MYQNNSLAEGENSHSHCGTSMLLRPFLDPLIAFVISCSENAVRNPKLPPEIANKGGIGPWKILLAYIRRPSPPVNKIEIDEEL